MPEDRHHHPVQAGHVDGMDAFMKDKVKLYTDAAGKLGLGKK